MYVLVCEYIVVEYVLQRVKTFANITVIATIGGSLYPPIHEASRESFWLLLNIIHNSLRVKAKRRDCVYNSRVIRC